MVRSSIQHSITSALPQPITVPGNGHSNESLMDHTARLERRVKQQNKRLEEIYKLSAAAEQEAEQLLEQVRQIGEALDKFLHETEYIPVLSAERF